MTHSPPTPKKLTTPKNQTTKPKQITHSPVQNVTTTHPHDYDITTIQEPYLNFNHNSHASHNWYTLYPKEHYTMPNKTRSLLLINKSMLTNKWSQIDFASSDMTATQIQTPIGPLLLINMYNDLGTFKGVQKVIQYMR